MKKYDQHKMKRTQIRSQQVADGMFDGRFKTKSIPSKKQYTRKDKHKGISLN